MDTLNASRRRTYDLPKSESGLTEWTSKIKALQRQVDEDEEAETRKLEEEIRISRMSRIRRSTLQGHPQSFDMSKPQNSIETASSSSDIEEFSDERQKNQETTMQRLVGQRNRNTTTVFSGSPAPSLPRLSPKPVLTPKQYPVSLAAFMGSKATGPRLNKHAPQQDAHDPTQYTQPGKISAAHPVFGKGGVAMPGMSSASQPTLPQPLGVDSVDVKDLSPPPPVIGQRQNTTPSVSERYVEKIERDNSTTNKTGLIRERTLSTPAGYDVSRPLVTSKLPPVASKPVPSRLPMSKSPLPDARPVDRAPVPSTYPSLTFALQHASLPSTPHKSSALTPALAGSAQSSPKPAFQGPHTVYSERSTAFLKPDNVQKDVTPSISRLQGRGFVKSMVKVSAQFEAAANSSSPPQTPEKATGSEGKKYISVLDRWPTAQPIISPQPPSMRKTKSANFSITTSTPAVPSKPVPSPVFKHKLQRFTSSSDLTQLSKPTSASPSSPAKPILEPKIGTSLSAEYVEEKLAHTPGVGSSNTLVSYIKPVKTGDSPTVKSAKPKQPLKSATSGESPIPFTKVEPPIVKEDTDELGVQNRNVGKRWEDHGKYTLSSPRPLSNVSSSETPLSHPTKDRARKPKKTKPMSTNKQDNSAASMSATHVISIMVPTTTTPDHTIPASSDPISLSYSDPQRREQNDRPTPSVLPTTAAVVVSSNNRPINSHASKLVDKWGNQPVIGVKSMLNGKGNPPARPEKSEHNGIVGKALPGLTTSSFPSTENTSIVKGEKSSSSSSPVRPTRIPSTGNRAKIMDVAQLWSEHDKDQSAEERGLLSRITPADPVEEVTKADVDVKAVIANWGARTNNLIAHSPSLPTTEKRKSSVEKSTALTLPTVKENSLDSTSADSLRNKERLGQPVDNDVKKADVIYSPIHVLHTSLNSEPGNFIERVENLVHFDNRDEPLPAVDIDVFMNVRQKKPIADGNAQTISIDVLSIVGNSSATVLKNPNVFYDTEVLAIIHRAKVKSSGLVESKVWGWTGKNSRITEREEKTMSDLAKRYGTTLIPVKQLCETSELVGVLGGQLAIRQGSRAHWSSENTTMHRIRVFDGYIFIDEQEDVSVRNLCSGFSYCVSILETLYVWHGRGSLPVERNAALIYANSLSGDPSRVLELNEGESVDDDMFWMYLGEQDYAQAHYWKWRPDSKEIDPRVWKVKIEAREQIYPVSFISGETELDRSVFILDCVWELFVLVGSEARGQRQDIMLALTAAMAFSQRSAASKPFASTVHVLISPTRLPLDLLMGIRDISEEQINNGCVPEHMNILPAAQALEHLDRSYWDKSALRDRTILPLGLHESHIS